MNPIRLTRRLETHKEQHGGKRERYSRGVMLNYKTFILLEVFKVAFLFFVLNHVFGSTEKSDWWLAHRRKRKLNWPTFVTKLVAGTLITTTSDPLERIQQPFKRKRVNVGQPGTTAGSVGLFIHNKSTPACSNRQMRVALGRGTRWSRRWFSVGLLIQFCTKVSVQAARLCFYYWKMILSNSFRGFSEVFLGNWLIFHSFSMQSPLSDHFQKRCQCSERKLG